MIESQVPDKTNTDKNKCTNKETLGLSLKKKAREIIQSQQ